MCDFFSPHLRACFYCFLEREEGVERDKEIEMWERNIDEMLSVHALTRNQTLLAYWTMFQPTKPPTQGYLCASMLGASVFTRVISSCWLISLSFIMIFFMSYFILIIIKKIFLLFHVLFCFGDSGRERWRGEKREKKKENINMKRLVASIIHLTRSRNLTCNAGVCPLPGIGPMTL